MEKPDLLFLIKMLSKSLAEDFNKRLQENGLTGVEGRVLFYISHKTYHENKEVHQNDLEKEFCLSKSTVSDLVKRMERKGFITRKTINRYVALFPTDEAVQKVEGIHAKRTETIDRLLEGFKEKEKNELQDYIKRLLNNMGVSYERKD